MKKKDILEMDSIAYYSGFDGLEVKGIEYGIDDYVLCVSGCWHGGKAAQRPHKLKIYDGRYIRLHGYRIPLSDCIRMGV